MIFEIPFDSKKTSEQHKLRLKLIFNKNLSKSSWNLLGSGIIICVAWLMIGDKDEVGYFFLSLGLFYCFNALFYFRHYMNTTKKLKRVYLGMVDLREKNKDSSRWEFNDDFFRYKDMYYDFSVRWEAFKGYKIIQRNLFLLLAESSDPAFIIGEEEVGEQEFAEVVATVSEKIKNIGE